MRSPFQGRYDSDLASALYGEYEHSRDRDVLEELLAQLCPLIRMTFKVNIGPKYRGHQGYLESNALNEVYRVVNDSSLPTTPRAFTNYLQTVIRRSLLDSLRDITPQIFDFWKVCRSPASSGYETHADTERSIYAEQRRDLLREYTRSRIRFNGNAGRACVAIIDIKLGYKSLDPMLLKRLYKIKHKKLKFLISYVDVLLRAATIEDRARV